MILQFNRCVDVAALRLPLSGQMIILLRLLHAVRIIIPFSRARYAFAFARLVLPFSPSSLFCNILTT